MFFMKVEAQGAGGPDGQRTVQAMKSVLANDYSLTPID